MPYSYDVTLKLFVKWDLDGIVLISKKILCHISID